MASFERSLDEAIQAVSGSPSPGMVVVIGQPGCGKSTDVLGHCDNGGRPDIKVAPSALEAGKFPRPGNIFSKTDRGVYICDFTIGGLPQSELSVLTRYYTKSKKQVSREGCPFPIIVIVNDADMKLPCGVQTVRHPGTEDLRRKDMINGTVPLNLQHLVSTMPPSAKVGAKLAADRLAQQGWKCNVDGQLVGLILFENLPGGRKKPTCRDLSLLTAYLVADSSYTQSFGRGEQCTMSRCMLSVCTGMANIIGGNNTSFTKALSRRGANKTYLDNLRSYCLESGISSHGAWTSSPVTIDGDSEQAKRARRFSKDAKRQSLRRDALSTNLLFQLAR